ncbi:MAG: IS30 family transposase [Butyricicoccus sp.]|nr:IS30 family transposase [Butyricicoccus sp.]
MNQVQNIIKHIKGKHLNFAQRIIIQIRTQDGWSPYRIAKELGCSSNTVRNELKRGIPELYWGKQKKYDASIAQQIYEGHRINSHRTPSFQRARKFLKVVEFRFRQQRWSFDACVGYSRRNREFTKQEMVCTKTLYNYTERGILSIKNIDLPQKVRRKPRTDASHARKNKTHLGRSIEDRPACVSSKERFGDWELDLVIGSKSKDDHVLMTLLERKTRYYKVIRLPDKTTASVMKAFELLHSEYKEHFSRIFKTITTDNGPEFSSLSTLEQTSDTMVYFAHPYSSFEKGANERHNGLLRRFIPKGSRIDSFSDDDLSQIESWINTLPRKALDFNTPRALFRKNTRSLSIPF